MMTQKPSSSLTLSKYMVVLPLLLMLFCCFNSTTSFAQDEKAVKNLKDLSSFPMFPNTECNNDRNCANRQFVKFLIKELKYPQVSLDNKVEGKVIVAFVVDKTGEIRDAKIWKGVSKELDIEALRVIKKMPNWISGVNKNGKKVSVKLKIPIAFVLPKEEGKKDRKK